jgi:hypothetical protein
MSKLKKEIRALKNEHKQIDDEIKWCRAFVEATREVAPYLVRTGDFNFFVDAYHCPKRHYQRYFALRKIGIKKGYINQTMVRK